MSKLKPHNDHAGYVAELRRGPVLPDGRRGWVTIYDAHEQQLDPDGGRWVTVCQTHSTLVNHTSQRAARATMKSGSIEFCDDCRDAELGGEA